MLRKPGRLKKEPAVESLEFPLVPLTEEIPLSISGGHMALWVT